MKSERVLRGHAQSLDSRFWILDSGFWSLESGVWYHIHIHRYSCIWYLWECKVSDQQLTRHSIFWPTTDDAFDVLTITGCASFSWLHLAWRHHDYSAIRGFLFWIAWNRQARFESGEHEFESVSLPSAPGEVTSINQICIWIGTDRSS